MNYERVVEEIVTKFFLNTCRLSLKLSEPAVQAAALCGQFAARHPTERDCIPLTTGSVAEFYIEPMIPHIGDIDVMYHDSTMLAIPAGHPPPTQLPDEFDNYVKVYEIVDSHLPGYVYLPLRYLLTECPQDAVYNTVEYDGNLYLSNRWYADGQQISIYGPMTTTVHGGSLYFEKHGGTTGSVVSNTHGPAVLTIYPGSQLLSTDAVYCIRCLVWPPQAADWPTRHRNYGWPDSATVDRVVSNGCDVVGVAHRQCRHDEWMSKQQWRLSFSRAEIVLVNSEFS